MKTVTRESSAFRTTRRDTFFTRKYAFLLLAGCLLTAAAANRGNGRVSQCNRLIAIVNEAADAQPDVLSRTLAEDNHRLIKTAIQLDDYADQLALMDFPNEPIQTFQTQFIQLYRDISKASSAVVTAPVSNFKVVSQANRTLIETQAREGLLVQEVNQYCQAK